MGFRSYSCHKDVRKASFAHIKTWKEEVKAEIKTKKAAGERFSVVVDEWTSATTRRYLNVVICTADSNIGLGLVRCLGSVTAAVTIDMVRDRLEEFGLTIEELVGISSDGASVMKKTGADMKIPHQLCHGKQVRDMTIF